MTKKSNPKRSISATAVAVPRPATAAPKKSKKPTLPEVPANSPASRPAPKHKAVLAIGGSKLNTIQLLLGAKQGASLEQLSKVTGWQHHSVRGAISGALKKKLGLKVTSERIDGVRIYRIAK